MGGLFDRICSLKAGRKEPLLLESSPLAPRPPWMGSRETAVLVVVAFILLVGTAKTSGDVALLASMHAVSESTGISQVVSDLPSIGTFSSIGGKLGGIYIASFLGPRWTMISLLFSACLSFFIFSVGTWGSMLAGWCIWRVMGAQCWGVCLQSIANWVDARRCVKCYPVVFSSFLFPPPLIIPTVPCSGINRFVRLAFYV